MALCIWYDISPISSRRSLSLLLTRRKCTIIQSSIKRELSNHIDQMLITEYYFISVNQEQLKIDFSYENNLNKNLNENSLNKKHLNKNNLN